MAILFVGEGRLGNQVFQYAAIRTLIGTGPLWTSGLGALAQVFELPPGLNRAFGTRFLESVIRKLLVPMVIRPLFKQMRLGHYCFEPVERLANGAKGMSGMAMRAAGLLETTFVDGGYYQNLSDLLSPADFLCLKLRADVLAEARAVAEAVTMGRAMPKAVMHVRRGDYIGFRSFGLDSVLLPVSYFQRAVAAARQHLGAHAEILIVTDDVNWCERELTALKPFTVISGSEAVDFALLSMFPVAILSNSTFSLAAACVGPGVERVIAPEFWFGHSIKQWYPPRIRARDPRFVYV